MERIPEKELTLLILRLKAETLIRESESGLSMFITKELVEKIRRTNLGEFVKGAMSNAYV